MEFLVQNHSSYPRGDGDSVDAVIQEQEHAGVDIVTDGQVRWPDPISHVTDALDGVRRGAMRRYFGTSILYRQPVITGTVCRRGPILRDDFSTARRAARACVKPVLPGPYTLARLSALEAGPYRDVRGLAHALSDVLAAEIGDLAAAGAELIQLEEPAILSHPEDIRLLREVLEPLWAARGRAQLMLATYFGDAEPLYAQLNSVPADVVAVDLMCGPAVADTIAAVGASKILALGVVDGRSARLEDADAVAHQVEVALKRYALDAIHVLPSCGLGQLSRSDARAKLELLARVRAMLVSRS